ncbi:hypothetical protein SteCoe_2744 [Stentor coeruleus]|uniref:Uncharacterized protein n=1 Tax=Stentor coeruleus TaxID=5963 RepID=A0A1R2CYQ6_9CILI|nr:hypothetical protein SteCoe_2744 [Stentor coeruleus]
MEGQRPRTRTELYEKRKLEMRKLGGEFMEKFVNEHPHIVDIPCQSASPYVQFAPQYVENPKIATKSELDFARRRRAILENEKTKNFNCKTLSERVEERERIMALTAPMIQIKRKMDEQRKKDLDQCKEKFSKRLIGIHGEELPKFSEHLQDYWKLKNGYIETPTIKSKEQTFSRPVSEFCRLRVKSSPIDYQIPLKPGEINPFPNYIPPESDITSLRGSSRSRFTDESFFSRPASQRISQTPSRDSKVSIPVTTNDRPVSEKKTRPLTANTRIKTSVNDKCLIRSRGFQ